MYSGMSASTGSFLSVGGSSCFQPSNICESRGKSLSDPAIFVGLCPRAKAIVLPTAVIALLTAGAVIWRPLPYCPVRTLAANPVSARVAVVKATSCK